jgi:FkbM family methyltransferase
MNAMKTVRRSLIDLFSATAGSLQISVATQQRVAAARPSSSLLFLRKIRLALTPRNSILQTRLSNGAVVTGYNREGFGGRGAYLFRDHLEPELSSLQCFLRPGFVVVDIGANVGVYSLKAAKEVGDDGLVIAIEPFVETASMLSTNGRANGYRNLRVRNIALGPNTREVQLYLNNGRPNSFGLIQSGTAESVSVLSVTLDDLCRWEGLERLDYLKIDAEGMEGQILAGGRKTLDRFRPIIQVEITKAMSDVPRQYLRFSAPRSPNCVFIPAENEHAISIAVSLGWAKS